MLIWNYFSSKTSGNWDSSQNWISKIYTRLMQSLNTTHKQFRSNCDEVKKKIGYCPENMLTLIETKNRLIVARIWEEEAM